MKLTFLNKNKARFVCEVLGVPEEQFRSLTENLLKYFKKAYSGDNTEKPTKTEILEEFLASQEFKVLNFPLKTANDYFLLGFAFNSVIMIIKPEVSVANLAELFHSLLPPHDHTEEKEEEERLPN